uniref:Uncharacterized protein n=1 Tax=Utricularia reniformis TaxID=192314 RepID=A0A1Y0B3U2_9LAMI|nr:hypothetical protein AEK19_MT1962 [Utricularia reniformis]ART32125.1 hypothetical protein AEK19_MT1962 [Utricularia reniformis]
MQCAADGANERSASSGQPILLLCTPSRPESAEGATASWYALEGSSRLTRGLDIHRSEILRRGDQDGKRERRPTRR